MANGSQNLESNSHRKRPKRNYKNEFHFLSRRGIRFLSVSSHRKRRKINYEDVFKLSQVSKSQVGLLSKFFHSHRKQITLPPTNLGALVWRFVYLHLESLLRLLRNNSVLRIVDFYSSNVIEKIQYMRDYKFGGSWFDSLQTLIADNVQYDDEHMTKLNGQESKLKTENNFVCDWLNMLSARLLKTDDLTSEHAEILRYRVKWFKRQRKLVESELANHMEKIKAVSDARKSLDFFYPT